MSDKARTPSEGAGRALVPFVPAPAAVRPVLPLRQILWAVGLCGAFGVGALGVHTAQEAWSTPDRAALQASVNAQLLQQLQGEIGRLKGSVDTLRTTAEAHQDDSLRNLKRSVETLKAEIEQVRTTDGTTLAQISTKIDKTDHDPSQKLADIVARLDRIEHEPAPKAADAATVAPRVADLQSRIDRLERQVSSPVPTGSIPSTPVPVPVSVPAPVHAPAATTSVPRAPMAAVAPKAAAAGPQLADAKPLPSRQPTLDAWVVRDVYDGMALVEGRRGGLREIEPGEFLPGAGEIRSIERRGRDWVVLTSQGVIASRTF